eukprot:3194507-Prymnesium_polylepis.1
MFHTSNFHTPAFTPAGPTRARPGAAASPRRACGRRDGRCGTVGDREGVHLAVFNHSFSVFWSESGHLSRALTCTTWYGSGTCVCVSRAVYYDTAVRSEQACSPIKA